MIYRIGNAYLRVTTALIMAAWLLFYSLAAVYGAEKYDRKEWPAFAKGAREQVIEANTVGMVRCAYTGALVPEEAMQIDHVVPVAVAWRLGAHTWPWDLRREFYNDPDNLVPALAGINASKGDKSPREWMPQVGRESYLEKWRVVCGKYGLSCDDREIGR